MGRFEETRMAPVSYRRVKISSKSSAAVGGKRRIPRSSITSRSMRVSFLISSGRVPVASALGQIERRAVVRGVASLDGGYRQTERNVALPRTRRSQQQQSAVLRNEPHGAQIQDERLGDLRVERPVEALQRLEL